MRKLRITAVFVCLFVLLSFLMFGNSKQTEQISTQKVYLSPSAVSVTAGGDINGDGYTNNKDLLRLFKYLSGWSVSVNNDALDVNCDGKVNNKDIVRLFKYLTDWNVQIFPVDAPCSHSGNTAVRNIVDVTCTEDGYSGDTYCLICGRKVVSGAVVPKSHNFTDYITNNDATCTADGTKTATCTRCGATDTVTDTGSALGHDYIIGSDDENHWQECTRCHLITGHESHTESYSQVGVCDFCGRQPVKRILAYSSLNSNQKAMYRKLDEAVTALSTKKVRLENYATDIATGESDLNVAFKALSFDKPEYFWLPRAYSVSRQTVGSSGAIVELSVRFANPNNLSESYYHVTAAEKAQMQTELEAEIAEIIAIANTYDNDYDKELFLHDYLCKTITYDLESAESATPDFNAFTAYGALVNKTCVCEGYSRAFELLCNRLGIPCSLVTGKHIRGSYDNGELDLVDHMWNIVDLGDGYMYVDTTFDDIDDDVVQYTHNCFNYDKQNFSYDHLFDDVYIPGNDYSNINVEYNFFEAPVQYSDDYYSHFGAYIIDNDYTNATSFIINAKEKGMELIDIYYDGCAGILVNNKEKDTKVITKILNGISLVVDDLDLHMPELSLYYSPDGSYLFIAYTND